MYSIKTHAPTFEMSLNLAPSPANHRKPMKYQHCFCPWDITLIFMVEEEIWVSLKGDWQFIADPHSPSHVLFN